MRCAGVTLFRVLILMVVAISAFQATEADSQSIRAQPGEVEPDVPVPGTTTVEEKMKEVREMFGTPYTEEMFYRADRLLLTATRHLMEARKAPAIATVITADEIRNMGARNLMDVLRIVPGIGVGISELPTKTAIEVRGIRTKNTEKILFMIDGHRMNNNFTGSAVNIINDLTVDNVKRVEVVRGPGSALYGANAFVAVINVVTMTAEDIDGLQLTAGGGSFNTQHYDALFGHEGSKVHIAAFFDYFRTDGPSFFIEEDAQTLNDRAHNTHASLAPGHTIDWQKKTDFGITISCGDFSFEGRVIDKDRGPYIGVGRALNDDTDQQFTHIFGDLSHSRRWTDNFDTVARIYGDYFRWDTYWEIFPDGFAGVYPNGLIGNPETSNSTLGAEVTANYLWSSHYLTGGVNYEDIHQFDTKHFTNFNPITFAPLPGGVQDISDWGNFNKDVDRAIWAVYLQDVWTLNDDLTLTAGVRDDYYSDFGNTINPRVGLVWEATKDLTLKALYGRAFRAPTFSELYTINNPAEVGNPDLSPEKINTYEAALEYRFLHRCTLKLNYFYNAIEDLIILGPKPSPTEPAPYINQNEARIQGVEAELNFDLGKHTHGFVNASYQDPRDGETGERLPDVPSWRSNLGLNVGLLKYLNANVTVSAVGERPRAKDDSRDDLSPSVLVDLTLIAKSFCKTLEIRGSVYNLFDEDYRDPSPFPPKVRHDFPNNSRAFVMEVRYRF